MNEIQLFNNPEFGEIRTIQIDNEPWFVGRDIAAALGYSATRNAIFAHVDDEDKLTHRISASGQGRDVILINESGVYALIFSSKLERAKAFKHWVTSEVLPQIRQTGGYAVPVKDEKSLDIQLMNARTANAQVYLSLMEHIDTKSESYKGILMAYAANTAAGQLVLPLPKSDFGKTYSATDIAQILGTSRNRIGRIANEYGIKTDEYGQWYHDITTSGKQVDNFRYNDAAISRFREILNA